VSTDPQRSRARSPVADVGLGRAVRRIGALARKRLLRLRLGKQWERTEQGLLRRVYPDYETYLLHQRTKFDAASASFLIDHDACFYEALSRRLAALPFPLERRSVLCLAARQGTEVRAFIERGAFTVGVDLNPGRDNRYVVVGDFHALQYGDRTVDVVYTNSLDHAFDLDRVIVEIRRVLAPEGRLIVELCGTDGGLSSTGFYESLSWSRVDDMVARIAAAGFSVESRAPFDVPWKGEQAVFRVTG
jgi:SAM-dependent methyltransferase